MSYSRNYSTSDVHQMMTSPNIISLFVNNYDNVVKYNVGMSSNIYIFINVQERQIYMKYFDSATGNDVIHVFELCSQIPTINQINELYSNNNKVREVNSCQEENIIQEIFKKIVGLEDKINKHIKGEGLNVSTTVSDKSNSKSK